VGRHTPPWLLLWNRRSAFVNVQMPSIQRFAIAIPLNQVRGSEQNPPPTICLHATLKVAYTTNEPIDGSEAFSVNLDGIAHSWSALTGTTETKRSKV
jgi:hypothetical protein